MSFQFKWRSMLRGSVLSVAFFAVSSFAMAGQLPTVKELQRLAPKASPEALRLALNAYQCATSNLGRENDLLTVIDFSKPSREKRLWVFDLKKRKVLFEEWVTHGKKSGEDMATAFSNRMNSHQSSLGLFQTGSTYNGKHGRSLRLLGLEPGFNDNSLDRAIVMHSASYASPGVVPGLGRLGRSLGCPALRPEVAQKVISTVQEGSYLFAYYPQKEWLAKSQFLAGASCTVAKIGKDARVLAKR